eukprot:15459326-Alexandrium_andersonii.AAC.1
MPALVTGRMGGRGADAPRQSSSPTEPDVELDAVLHLQRVCQGHRCQVRVRAAAANGERGRHRRCRPMLTRRLRALRLPPQHY